MGGINGADVLLLANTGTDASPVWTAIGSQRGVTFNESQATIDFSSKTSGRAERIGPGRWSGTVDLESLYVPNDASYGKMKESLRFGVRLKMRREFAGNQVEELFGYIEDLSEDFPDQEAATVSATFHLDGFPNAV